jgi:hypothetical protein
MAQSLRLPFVRSGAMSRRTVGLVIERLLADEDLRIQFAMDPVEALAQIHRPGIELTPDEIDAFLQTDARIWFGSDDLFGRRVH